MITKHLHVQAVFLKNYLHKFGTYLVKAKTLSYVEIIPKFQIHRYSFTAQLIHQANHNQFVTVHSPKIMTIHRNGLVLINPVTT